MIDYTFVFSKMQYQQGTISANSEEEFFEHLKEFIKQQGSSDNPSDEKVFVDLNGNVIKIIDFGSKVFIEDIKRDDEE
jgi:hypothetical protein